MGPSGGKVSYACLGDVVLEIWAEETALKKGKTERFSKEGSASVHRESLGSVGKIAGGLGAVFGGIQIASE